MMMELLVTFHDDREPMRLHCQAPLIILKNSFTMLGAASVINPGELVGEQVYGANEIETITVFGHPPEPEPEQPPEYEEINVTPESFFGAPSPDGSDPDESYRFRVRKRAQSEKAG